MLRSDRGMSYYAMDTLCKCVVVFAFASELQA